MGIQVSKDRTATYIGTFHYSDQEDMRQLSELRKMVVNLNKSLKESGYDIQYYVKAQGRLGKNNPNAFKYRKGYKSRYYHPAQTIHLKDASHVDAYIYKR